MNLKSVSTSQLNAELERRQRDAKKLEAKRRRLLSELEKIDSQLPTRSGGPASSKSGGKRRRARNDISLPDAIAKAMEVRAVVSPAEAAELVRRNGFKTTSQNFNMMVSNALAKDPRFKRLSRGQYERVS